jgi:hypothetical protein
MNSGCQRKYSFSSEHKWGAAAALLFHTGATAIRLRRMAVRGTPPGAPALLFALDFYAKDE